MTNITPGNWQADPIIQLDHDAPGEGYQCGITTRGNHIGTAYGETREEATANARLMASAPDLRAALEAAESKLSEYRETGHMTGWDATLREVRAALSRAQG